MRKKRINRSFFSGPLWQDLRQNQSGFSDSQVITLNIKKRKFTKIKIEGLLAYFLFG